MVDIIKEIPAWYIFLTVIFSLYYATRGVIEQSIIYKNNELFNRRTRVFVHYIQEFLFKTIFTISSFLALFIANHIFSSFESINNISAGTAALLIFLLIWGVTGISGYLTFLTVSGKFPGK